MDFIAAQVEHYAAIARLVSSPEELYWVSPKAHYPWDSAQLQAIADERQGHTVCLINGVVVAYANLYQISEGQSAFIGNVIVAEAYKGQGLGKALVQHMMLLCKKQYRAVAHLAVFANNTRALLLYAQLGFEPYAIESRLGLNGESLALLQMRALGE